MARSSASGLTASRTGEVPPGERPLTTRLRSAPMGPSSVRGGDRGELRVRVTETAAECRDELPQHEVAERGLHEAVLAQRVALDRQEVAEAFRDHRGGARVGV